MKSKILTGFILLIAFLCILKFKQIPSRTPYRTAWQNYFDCIGWIKDHTPDSHEISVILARKPQFVYLFSSRKSMIYPYTKDIRKQWRVIDSCDYILVDECYQSTIDFLIPAIEYRPREFKIVFQKGNTFVLKILK